MGPWLVFATLLNGCTLALYSVSNSLQAGCRSWMSVIASSLSARGPTFVLITIYSSVSRVGKHAG
eukprot:254662-Pelagomonas_calceolata.AAC.7